jgi:hypothetical protein
MSKASRHQEPAAAKRITPKRDSGNCKRVTGWLLKPKHKALRIALMRLELGVDEWIEQCADRTIAEAESKESS